MSEKTHRAHGPTAGDGCPHFLQLLVKLAGGAGNENPAGGAAFAVLHPFDDARGLAALGAVGALGGVHYLLTVSSLGNLGHSFSQFFGVGSFYPKSEALS